MLHPRRQPTHDSGQDTQARILRVFGRSFEEELQTDTDSQKRTIRGDELSGNHIQAAAAQRSGARPERADSRQHQRVGLPSLIRIASESSGRSHILKGLFGGTEVPDPVVQDGD